MLFIVSLIHFYFRSVGGFFQSLLGDEVGLGQPERVNLYEAVSAEIDPVCPE